MSFAAVAVLAVGCAPPSPAEHTVQIAAGFAHACALRSDGTVHCWGSNYGGQLGTSTNAGTFAATSRPVAVPNLSDVVAISAGGSHNCAVRSDKRVFCWGSNDAGQLGVPTDAGTSIPHPTPIEVPGLSAVKEVAAGFGHTCAVREDGTVACWGRNIYGQLGNSTNTGSISPNPTPTVVAGLTNVVGISTGVDHVCASLADRTARCWGRNIFGELGVAANAGTLNASPSPVNPAGAVDVDRVVAAFNHTCAVQAGGSVACWGWNRHGQLGVTTNQSTDVPNPAPLAVGGLSDGISVSGGGSHTCAVLSDRSAACWGRNFEGALGTADGVGSETPNPTPSTIAGLGLVSQLVTGSDFSCALNLSRQIFCWGSNQAGQIGTAANAGTTSPIVTPTRVVGV